MYTTKKIYILFDDAKSGGLKVNKEKNVFDWVMISDLDPCINNTTLLLKPNVSRKQSLLSVINNNQFESCLKLETSNN